MSAIFSGEPVGAGAGASASAPAVCCGEPGESLKFTVTVMITGTGFPASSVGV